MIVTHFFNLSEETSVASTSFLLSFKPEEEIQSCHRSACCKYGPLFPVTTKVEFSETALYAASGDTAPTSDPAPAGAKELSHLLLPFTFRNSRKGDAKLPTQRCALPIGLAFPRSPFQISSSGGDPVHRPRHLASQVPLPHGRWHPQDAPLSVRYTQARQKLAAQTSAVISPKSVQVLRSTCAVWQSRD